MSRLRSMNVHRDDTRRMEEETRKMECKMEALRRVMEEASGGSGKGDSGSRWKSGSAARPLRRDYVKEVLTAPKTSTRQAEATRRPAPSPSPPLTSSPLAAKRTSTPQAAATDLGNGGYPPKGIIPRPPEMPKSGTLLSETSGAISENGSPSKPGAASNLQAALSRQNDDFNDVEALLAELKLDRYAGLFCEHGFDCMDVVMDMQESHMREIGMAAGHALKLQKKLSEIKGEAAPPPPARAASDPRGPPSVKFGKTETMEIQANPGGSGGFLTGNFDEAESAASFQEALKAWRGGGSQNEPAGNQTAAANTATAGSSSLMDGPGFDEKESADSFQEALKAWREGGKSAPQGDSAPSKPVGSFWASVGEQEVNLERASTPLAKVPADMCFAAQAEAQVKMGPASNEEKLCCYSCYKQFFKKHAVERYDVSASGAQAPAPPRRFCSDPCADRWTTVIEAKAEAARKRLEEKERLRNSIAAAEAGCAEAATKAAAAEAEVESIVSTPTAASAAATVPPQAVVA
eukprot:TRINITY_DN18433_c0_g1_i1.p1 TRINITY_DN18433_c0_g1~~TRINITY_DN18433_c0_g1_i1.p1  ORF type:complete len:520 (+),score=134.59 TRINITY_DN18433_c0_g1_i1:116-1675(+)